MMRGNVVTHNHPGGGFFSAGDLLFFLRVRPSELRAVQPGGGVYVMRTHGLTEAEAAKIRLYYASITWDYEGDNLNYADNAVYDVLDHFGIEYRTE